MHSEAKSDSGDDPLLNNLSREELNKLCDRVEDFIETIFPKDTVFVLVIGDQDNFRSVVSNRGLYHVPVKLDFVAAIIEQQILESN